MLYDDLQRRYGPFIAKRIKHDLSPNELIGLEGSDVERFLERRAEKMAADYKALMDNPLERGNMRSEILHRRWRDAEDLCYLMIVAKDVADTVRASMVTETTA